MSEVDEAFSWMDKALSMGYANFKYLDTALEWSELRQFPRYQELKEIYFKE